MDSDCEHGRLQVLFVDPRVSYFARQAIAINPEMIYSILGVKGDPSAGVTIVASERKEALEPILSTKGFTEEFGQIQGPHF